MRNRHFSRRMGSSLSSRTAALLVSHASTSILKSRHGHGMRTGGHPGGICQDLLSLPRALKFTETAGFSPSRSTVSQPVQQHPRTCERIFQTDNQSDSLSISGFTQREWLERLFSIIPNSAAENNCHLFNFSSKSQTGRKRRRVREQQHVAIHQMAQSGCQIFGGPLHPLFLISSRPHARHSCTTVR